MSKDKKLVDPLCIICQREKPKSRSSLSLTCKPVCAKIYLRIERYIRSRIVSKHITENKHLKKQIKKLEEVLC